MRWQGHVGFYIKIERPKAKSRSMISPSKSTESFPAAWLNRFVKPIENGDCVWTVTAGTYPVSKDRRGMRLESVELLAQLIRTHLGQMTVVDDDLSYLTAEGVMFLVNAMDVVASHPISTYDLVQDEGGRLRQRATWKTMDQRLNLLMRDGKEVAGRNEPKVQRPRSIIGRSYTPY